MSRWSPVYVSEIETERHVKNNTCGMEIKIKWMIRKQMTYENIYRDDISLRSVLLVEEIGIPGENHLHVPVPVASH